MYEKELVNFHEEITPRFNRDGLYLDRETNYAWFEVFGRAFKYSKDDVLYRLGFLNASEVGIETYRALKELKRINPKALSDQQRAFMQVYPDVLHNKRLKQSTLLRNAKHLSLLLGKHERSIQS